MDSAAGKSSFLSFLSLFTSVGTLLCCALPSLLVLAGLGTTVASTLSALPWLVTLSRHKSWTFAISGIMIAASFVYTYYASPRLRARACDPQNPEACEVASRFSKAVLWLSAVLFLAGFFAAFFLRPILARFDQP